MSIRNGAAYIAGLQARPREVWIAGRKVADVTADPAFHRPVAEVARLYDLQCRPELQEVMTYHTESGARAGMSFLTPKSREDMTRRREAMRIWAEASFGLLGRSPDFLNTIVMAFADAPEFFARRGDRFAQNVADYYAHCRDNDLFLTHAIVGPQVDRSKPAGEQADEFAYLGVVRETSEGLIVRGAKMLATHGPIADELLVYPLPGMLRPGEERYALAFAIEADAPGLRFVCREPFDEGTQSPWDHPLGARFEEPDAMVLFEDVLVPWKRVFLHGDVTMANTLFQEARLQNHSGQQTAVRGLAKCRLVVGIAIAMTRAIKTDVFLHVQEQLGELLGYLDLLEGTILLAEEKSERNARGTVMSGHFPLQTIRYHLPRFYARMVEVLQTIAGGSLLINPTEADLEAAIGPEIERYYRGAGVSARDRIRLFKLAWDATGTQFGQRQLHYERYYAGDPVRVAAAHYQRLDMKPLLAFVERALTEG